MHAGWLVALEYFGWGAVAAISGRNRISLMKLINQVSHIARATRGANGREIKAQYLRLCSVPL